MPAGHGVRARTRDTFARPFRGKGYINLTTYLRTFKLGDYVDIKVNGAVHSVRELPTPPPPPNPPTRNTQASLHAVSLITGPPLDFHLPSQQLLQQR